MSASPYSIPAGVHRVRETIKRSRFITTVSHAPEPEAAHTFVTRMRAEFGDATHNCWAFVAGPPGSMAHVGMSDDHEPHGTAGKPLLPALPPGGVGGPEISRRVRELFPEVRVLYMSGYAAHSMLQGETIEESARLIQKHFRRRELQNAISEILALSLFCILNRQTKGTLPADPNSEFRS